MTVSLTNVAQALGRATETKLHELENSLDALRIDALNRVDQAQLAKRVKVAREEIANFREDLSNSAGIASSYARTVEMAERKSEDFLGRLDKTVKIIWEKQHPCQVFVKNHARALTVATLGAVGAIIAIVALRYTLYWK
jgi:hypothetical protein